MPLPTTSLYPLSSLRQDGRRWNELRRIHAQISTQASADGSSYLEMGNTKVLCVVSGPSEPYQHQQNQQQRGKGGKGGGGGGEDENRAVVEVEVHVAGFSGVDRPRRKVGGRGGAGGDRRVSDLQTTLSSTFSSALLTNLYPRSKISIALHVLSLDGALLAACLNAATLALVDAGVPMVDYMVACTAGSTIAAATITTTTSTGGAQDDEEEESDPLLDLNGTEEQELPFLTVGTLGAGEERVGVLVMESRVPVGQVEGMLAVGVDGCKQVREILDGVVQGHGKRLLEGVPG